MSISEKKLVNDGQYEITEYDDPPPDGGYGWVCCGCVTVMNFITWGTNSAYGVFLSYYLSHDIFKGGNETTFGLMGGIVIALSFSLLPLSTILMKVFGYRTVQFVAISVEAASFVGASFATNISQLFVCQGFLLGLSSGIIFGCNQVVIPGWFLKKRSLANGICQAGIALGGVVFAFSSNALIHANGDYKWALRMIGIVVFVLGTISMLLVRIRKEDTRTLKEVVAKTQDFRALKNTPLLAVSGWAGFTTVGFVVLLHLMSNITMSLGFDASKATLVSALFNVGQCIGRPLTGYLCERCGRVNYTIVCMVCSLILLLAFWFNISTYPEMASFSVIIGLWASVSNVSVAPLVVDIVGFEHIVSGLGFATVCCGAGALVSETIALHLRNYQLKKPYLHVQVFVVVMYFAGLLCLLPYREYKVRRIFNAREEYIQPGWRGYASRCFKWIHA